MTTHAPAYYRDVIRLCHLQESLEHVPQWFLRAWEQERVSIEPDLYDARALRFKCDLWLDTPGSLLGLSIMFRIAVRNSLVLHVDPIWIYRKNRHEWSDRDLWALLKDQLQYNGSVRSIDTLSPVGPLTFSIAPPQVINYLQQQLEPVVTWLWQLGVQEIER